MNHWKKGMATIGAISLTALSLSAAPRPGNGPDGMLRGADRPGIAQLLDNEKALQRLGLSEDQVGALKARLADAEKTMIKLRAEVALAEAEVRNLMRQDIVDRAAVMKAVEAAGAAHLALRKALVEERLAFREIVGPEAAKKARRHLAQCRREDGDRGGPGSRGERWDRRGPPPFAPDEE